jgi:branched-chain amino acid transport system substrate-binding protein
MRWDGARWDIVSGWVEPLHADREAVKVKYVDSARQYAKEKGITPRKCPAD